MNRKQIKGSALLVTLSLGLASLFFVIIKTEAQEKQITENELLLRSAETELLFEKINADPEIKKQFDYVYEQSIMHLRAYSDCAVRLEQAGLRRN